MKQPLPSWAASTLAFFALVALLVGVVWIGNAPTVKADRVAMGRCVDVCTASANCALVCVDPNYPEPITCEQFGVCAVPTPTPTPTAPIAAPNAVFQFMSRSR